MEPVTHFLTGACLARAGANRRTAYATLAMTLAAEAPDLDVLWSLQGPVAGFAHHRGLSHTFAGAPVVATAVTAAVWVWHRIRRGKGRMQPPSPPPRPVHWGWLWLFSLLAALSHILLDWTNNYGVRPWFPWSGRWYAGDLVFIVEPALLALLGGALLAPALAGLVEGEMSARRRPWRGQGWALAALLGMAALWGWRALEHGRALALARTALEEDGAAAGRESAPGVLAVAAEPYPFNPFHWHGIAATPAYYRDADVDTLRAAVTLNPRGPVYRAAATPAVAAASGSWLGRVYLDWARFPVVDELGPVPLPGFPPPPVDAGQRWTTVRFRDMRFLYRQPGLGDPSELRRPPLAGFVYIVDGRAEAGMFLSGREQK